LVFQQFNLFPHVSVLDNVMMAPVPAMPLQFASRLDNVETSAIRELFKLLGKPGIISFAGGFPDSAMFDVEGLREASQKALAGGAGRRAAVRRHRRLRAAAHAAGRLRAAARA
jgi:ABC-type histidine transport system ATPase subunit